MPYTTSVAGTTVTASWANANVRDQVITPFASASARDAAITSPVEGMVAYLSDRDILTFYNGTSWNDLVQGGAWDQTYTPTLTQSATVTKTVTLARYTKIGKLVIGHVSLAVTSSGTATNAILFGLPVTGRTSGIVIGSGYVFDTSANITYAGAVQMASTSTCGILLGSGGISTYAGATGGGMTAAIASGDAVVAHFMYEAA